MLHYVVVFFSLLDHAQRRGVGTMFLFLDRSIYSKEWGRQGDIVGTDGVGGVFSYSADCLLFFITYTI